MPGRSAGRPACGKEGKSAARAAAAASRLCCSAAAETAAMVTCNRLFPSCRCFALISPHHVLPLHTLFAKRSSCSASSGCTSNVMPSLKEFSQREDRRRAMACTLPVTRASSHTSKVPGAM